MDAFRFQVRKGTYVPDMSADYPTDDPYRRLVRVQEEDSSKGRYRFDETYPYIDKSWGFRLNRIPAFFIKWVLIALYNRFHFGLRITGKENARKSRREAKNGAVCVCNHVFIFDALGVHSAVRRFRQVWIPMYAKHFNGSSSYILRHAGGIPLPETRGGIRKFNEAFDEYNRRKDWFIIFPEEVRWDMYAPIRPFRIGAFSMAYKYNRPVIPFVYTYRKRKGLYRLFGKKSLPCVTLHIGEPIWFDKSAPRKAELDRVRRLAHEAMERMAGIEFNPWPVSDDLFYSRKAAGSAE